ncbi:MAG: hypothetical protein ACE15E_07375 [Acidobacteriota bacterium]
MVLPPGFAALRNSRRYALTGSVDCPLSVGLGCLYVADGDVLLRPNGERPKRGERALGRGAVDNALVKMVAEKGRRIYYPGA